MKTIRFISKHRELIIQSGIFFLCLLLTCAADGIGDWVYAAMMVR